MWIAKSNSLRRTAQEKEKTRKDVEDKIVNVLDELKKTGFSVNKQLEVENLQERSFIAQRFLSQ